MVLARFVSGTVNHIHLGGATFLKHFLLCIGSSEGLMKQGNFSWSPVDLFMCV